MAGIYIHIPFCKQACYYCDFHFSTNQSYRSVLVEALCKELSLQKDYLSNDNIETIYFGGGTPSILSEMELEKIINTISKIHPVVNHPELTIEVNPDDVTSAKFKNLKDIGFNRISLGVQSFEDEVLRFMNRAHYAQEVFKSVDIIRASGFDNLSIDLIHSIPIQNERMLIENLNKTVSIKPEHISVYSLTIEEKTVFGRWQKSGKLIAADEVASANQFELVMDFLIDAGYQHYEISNFALPGYVSKHNSSYWQQKKYLGVGPSAHSYNQISRQYNIANNHQYIKSLDEGKVPCTQELLTRENKINEYIFTSLRTHWGCDNTYLTEHYQHNLLENNFRYLEALRAQNKLVIENNRIILTRQGKLLADQIAADLFVNSN